TQLSELDISGIVSDPIAMEQRYKAALEVRARIDDQEMQNTLSDINQLRESLKNLSSKLVLQVESQQTNIMNRIGGAINTFISTTRTEIDAFNTFIFDPQNN